jgi:putative restriction endonuclease
MVRYQFQTWGGSRTPESRITDFSPLRRHSSKDDILIFQRHIDSVDMYRIILIKQDSQEYDSIARLVDNGRWGILDTENPPITQSEIEEEKDQLDEIVALPFRAINPEITRHQSKRSIITRSTLFREQVCREYGNRCAISSYGICTPEETNSLYEVQAAHIVPVSVGGTNDIRNGIPLTHTLHWAFDQGLIGIDPETRRVFVPPRVLKDTRNEFLHRFDGHQMLEAANDQHKAHNEALVWHRENVVSRWE